MTAHNIFETISSQYFQLTNSEKKVADYVLRHRIDVQYMSISELAEECTVADATISPLLPEAGADWIQRLQAGAGQGIDDPGQPPGGRGHPPREQRLSRHVQKAAGRECGGAGADHPAAGPQTGVPGRGPAPAIPPGGVHGTGQLHGALRGGLDPLLHRVPQIPVCARLPPSDEHPCADGPGRTGPVLLLLRLHPGLPGPAGGGPAAGR